MIIGLHGTRQADVDFVASAMHKQLAPRGWKLKTFKSKVIEVASILTGIPVKEWSDPAVLRSEMPDIWENYVQISENDGDKGEDGYGFVVPTHAEFLRKLEQSLKTALHKNVFAHALFSEYKKTKRKTEDEEYISDYPNWILQDMEGEEVTADKISVHILRLEEQLPADTADKHFLLMSDNPMETLQRITEFLQKYHITT